MYTKSIRTKGKDFATSFSGDRFRMAPAQTDHIDKLFDHLVELPKNNLSIVASAEWLVTIANVFHSRYFEDQSGLLPTFACFLPLIRTILDPLVSE